MTAIPHREEDNGHSWRLSPVLAMDEHQFQQWIALLEQRSGVHLPSERKSFLLTSLAMRMRKLGYGDYQSYYNYLLDSDHESLEWEVLIDKLTVHETRFFRDHAALELIRDFLRQQKNPARHDKFRLWSVGCATGEEPYSLAMLLDDHLSHTDHASRFHVTATDISLLSLTAAMRGVYRHNRGSNMPEQFKARYTNLYDKEHFQVKKSLREHVSFAKFNLQHLDKTAIQPKDVIICQNVLIYFKRQRRLAILDNLVKHLRPGGLLILGAGEITGWKNPAVQSFIYPATLAFQRVDDGVTLEEQKI